VGYVNKVQCQFHMVPVLNTSCLFVMIIYCSFTNFKMLFIKYCSRRIAYRLMSLLQYPGHHFHCVIIVLYIYIYMECLETNAEDYHVCSPWLKHKTIFSEQMASNISFQHKMFLKMRKVAVSWGRNVSHKSCVMVRRFVS
jgi:hypothetical protein